MSSYAVDVDITTDSNGDQTAYSQPVSGRVSHIAYVKTDFANGVDFTVTSERTRQNIWVQENVNASAAISPVQPAHTSAGDAVTYDGTRPIYRDIVLAAERIKFVIAAGGATKTGKFRVTLVD